jgi:pimeloyl-ACP methyl ester carboxylesterase
MWDPQFRALQKRFRFLVPDFPGFGLSAPPNGLSTLDDFASDLVRLLDQHRVEKVVVAGLSMGGYVAFRLIEKLGDRMSGLFLADTRTSADSEEAAVARHELAAEVESQGVEVAAGELLPKLLGMTTQRTQPQLIDHVHSLILESSPAGVANALRAMAARQDSQSLLKQVRCPILCVTGEEDTITPPEVARGMVEGIGYASVETIPDAGHLSNLESPETFNRILEQFVARAAG